MPKGIKINLILLFSIFIILPISFIIFNINWIHKSFFHSSDSLILNYDSYIIVQIVFATAFVIFITGLSLLIYKKLIIPFVTVKNEIKKINSDLSEYIPDSEMDDEILKISNNYKRLAKRLYSSNSQLETKTSELTLRNDELQDANFQLEASYGQLQAIIEQLNEAEQKYHTLIKNIPDIVCVVDKNGFISYVNGVFCDLTGYSNSELMGKELSEYIKKESAVFSTKRIFDQIKEDGQVNTEIILITKPGLYLICEARFSNYIVNGINMGLQAIIRDVTVERSMEERIIESNMELATINTVSKSLTSTLDLDELLNMIVKEVTDHLNFSACVLSLFDSSESGLLRAKAFSGNIFDEVTNLSVFPPFLPDDRTRFELNKGFLLLNINDLPNNWLVPKINLTLHKDLKLKESLIIPINIKNKNIGILAVHSKNKFKTKDISLISSIANNAAIAIENAILYDTSRKYFIKTIDVLIAAVEAKDSYTEGHSQRVSKYAVSIANKMGLDKDRIEDIKIAGILHDVGKIGIKDEILQKCGRLDEGEYELIKQHPSISNKILYPVGFSDRTLKAIAFHHERFDGLGYPFGLSGDGLSIEAQIISVADAYDAMTSNRSYRQSMSKEAALLELTSNKGKQFNPFVVDIFTDVVNNIQ